MLSDAVYWLFDKFDYKIMRRAEYYALCPGGRDVDIRKDEAFLEVFGKVRDFTMAGIERAYGLYLGVRYVVEHDIPGDIVECGVWRGGSCMLAALTLQQLGDTGRDLWLYDTFAGLTEPTEKDLNWGAVPAIVKWREKQQAGHNDWCYAPLDEVQRNMAATGYPADRLHYVKGPVEQTIPGAMPGPVSLLRLDTDWYESTYHLLVHLYPQLVPLGVLVVDDYGHWQGAREAADRYLGEHRIPLLLTRVDYTGRVAVKPKVCAERC